MIHRNGTVFVTDFGVARMMESATVTLLGAGTPAYMAPEIVAGSEPSSQTDIYALGVILFEMLTGGERPFTGDLASITGSTGEKVRWEHVNIKPPSLRRWNVDISNELEKMILTCLEKSPWDRYTSVLNFLESLKSALDQLEQKEILVGNEEGRIEPDYENKHQPVEVLEFDAVLHKEHNVIELDKAGLEDFPIVDEDVAIISDESPRDLSKVDELFEEASGVSRELEPKRERESEDIHSNADQIMARKIFLIMIAGILVTFLGLILLSKP